MANNTNTPSEPRAKPSYVGLCPKCRQAVYAAENHFYCRGRLDKSCDWSLPRTFKGTPLDNEDVAKMLTGNHTKWLRFKWKNRTFGYARLSLKDGRIQWEFQNND